MSKIEEILNYFVEVTRNSIISLEQDDLENAEVYIKKREETIQQLKLLEYTKDEFKSIVNKIDLFQLDLQLEKLLKENITKVKDEIRDFNIAKEAYVNYNKFAGKMPKFLNEKI